MQIHTHTHKKKENFLMRKLMFTLRKLYSRLCLVCGFHLNTHSHTGGHETPSLPSVCVLPLHTGSALKVAERLEQAGRQTEARSKGPFRDQKMYLEGCSLLRSNVARFLSILQCRINKMNFLCDNIIFLLQHRLC